MMFCLQLNSNRILKRLAKALISLRIRTGVAEPLLVAVGNPMLRLNYVLVENLEKIFWLPSVNLKPGPKLQCLLIVKEDLS